MPFGAEQATNPANPAGRPREQGRMLPLKRGGAITISDRNKITSMRLMDKYCPRAVMQLCKMIETGDMRVRIKAIELLLAYGLGKPRETVQITGADGADLMPSITINVGSARTEVTDARGQVVTVQPTDNILVNENQNSSEPKE